MTDTNMNFQAPAPRIAPRILCIGIPVRDLTFRVTGVPARGSKENASHFDEICGGNSLNAGSIPSKSIVKSASVYAAMNKAEQFGAPIPNESPLDFAQVLDRMRRIRKKGDPTLYYSLIRGPLE